MTKIREETFVRCPPQRAQGYLLEYLRSLGSENGGSKLKLTATVGSKEGPHVTLSRDAVATLEPLSNEPLEYRVLINWAPTSTEPLPKFNGAFHVQWDEEYGNCRLIIEGSYEPPLGAIGKIFDAVAGERIAHTTMAALLANVRDAIESAYQRDMRKSGG